VTPDAALPTQTAKNRSHSRAPAAPAPGAPRALPPLTRPPARSHAPINVAPLAHKSFATSADSVAIINTVTGGFQDAQLSANALKNRGNFQGGQLTALKINTSPEPTSAPTTPSATLALIVSNTRPPAIAVHKTVAWARKRAEPVAAFRARVLEMAEYYQFPYVLFFPKPHPDIPP